METVDVWFDDTGDLDWASALSPHARSARSLLAGFDKQIQEHVGGFGAYAVGKAVTALVNKFGTGFASEAQGIADAIGADLENVVLANLAYDLAQAGCSTYIVPTINGPIHARTLDWDFPRGLLRRLTTAYRVRNAPSGDYTLVGWPGFFGALTGVAPGRFSVTVNYVENTDFGRWEALKNAVAGHWPVPWLVRRAFDEAGDFKSAVRILQSEPVMSPVLFTVAGTSNDEKVVIERCPDAYAARKVSHDSHIITANAYQHDAYLEDNETDNCYGCNGNGGLANGVTCAVCDGSRVSYTNDSVERIEFLDETIPASEPATCEAAIDVLFDGDAEGLIAYQNTQHAVAMCARTGELWVAVPGIETVEVET